MRINSVAVVSLLALGAIFIAGCPGPAVVATVDAGTDMGTVIRTDGGPDAGRDGGGDGGAMMGCTTGCLVGTTCHAEGTVNPTNPCEICTHATSATAFSPNNGATCDDGMFCTTDDVCAARACTGTARVCDDGIACNGVSTCNETTNMCVAGTTTCTGGQLCDAVSGMCVSTCPGCSVGTNCYGEGQVDPTSPCRVCTTATSRTAFSPGNNGATCDDGLFCTRTDVCAAGTCMGGGARCGDGVVCNGSETCDETGDLCAVGTTTCSAAEVCDVASDRCVPTCSGCVIGGVCFGDGQRNPANQCEVCAVATSRTAFSPNAGAICDDGLFCTSSDVCTGTVCGGVARSCSDGIACNGAETCNEAAAACRPGTSTCGGGTVCDPGTDACVTTCGGCTIGGICYAAGEVNTMNPCEVCRTATPTVWSANDGARCDDGLFCTETDLCTARACAGTARVCADAITCNGTETCNEAAGRCDPGTTTCGAGQVCNTTTNSCVATCTGCVVGGTCYAPGTTDPLNVCQVCDTARSRVAFSTNDGAACNDGLFCTRSDVCGGGLCAGNPANFCLDMVTCNGTETCNESTDSCVPGSTTCGVGQVCNVATNMCVTACTGCVIGGTCFAANSINPTNQCQICRVATPTVWSTNTGGSCDDTLFCTAVDTCNSSAVCTGTARNCSDGAMCSGVETCNEGTDRCDPGTPTCAPGTTCNVPTDTCILTCAGCLIGGVCYAPGTTDNCLVCSPGVSTTSWTNRPNGTSCDDRQYCTVTDQCLAGVCTGGSVRNCQDGITCNGVEVCNETTDDCDNTACVGGAPCCGVGTFCDQTTAPGVCSSSCAGTICGSTCTNIATDPNNCGMCSNICPARLNSTRLCGGSPVGCQYSCQAGFLDCNGGTDGCEIDRLNDRNNCGTCGNVCPAMNSCSVGVCVPRGAFVIPYTSQPTAGATVVFGAGVDDQVSTQSMGMNFTFFGNTYSTIQISSNGVVGFGGGLSGSFSPQVYPAVGFANSIALNWNDLYTGPTATVTAQLLGTAPNRVYVVSYNQIGHCCSGIPPQWTMQVMLYETSNIVEVHTLVGPAGRIATQAVADLSNTTVFALPGRNRGTYGPLSMDGVRFFTN